MEKTVTIKRGDLVDAYLKMSDTDESTKKLFSDMPILHLVIGLLMVKIEETLLEEEDAE